MPSGVEHAFRLAEQVAQAVEQIPSMPSGVEHQQDCRFEILPALRADSFDAVRR